MVDRLEPIHLPHAPVDARSVGDLQALAEARREGQAKRAYERGLADGKRAAVDSGVSALEAALERIEAAGERAQEELARQSVELAVEIARSLLQVRIEAGEFDLERIVRGALADAEVGRGSVVVHLHPDDHALLEEPLFRTGTALSVDPNLSRGDVHLSTPRGLLVRELEAALTSIREQLQEELAR